MSLLMLYCSAGDIGPLATSFVFIFHLFESDMLKDPGLYACNRNFKIYGILWFLLLVPTIGSVNLSSSHLYLETDR
jgi:hypothetical protein